MIPNLEHVPSPRLAPPKQETLKSKAAKQVRGEYIPQDF